MSADELSKTTSSGSDSSPSIDQVNQVLNKIVNSDHFHQSPFLTSLLYKYYHFPFQEFNVFYQSKTQVHTSCASEKKNETKKQKLWLIILIITLLA